VRADLLAARPEHLLTFKAEPLLRYTQATADSLQAPNAT
jgi:hypothetical protein